MRKWLWIAPILLAAGCSRSQSSNPQSQKSAGTVQAASVTPAPAAAPDTSPIADTAAEPVSAQPAPALVIPRGTMLRVRMDETLSTRRNYRGDRFTATLIRPVVVEGDAALPAGTRLSGHVVAARPSGRLKGRAELVLVLDSFIRDGHRYSITTTTAARVSRAHKKRDLLAIGGGLAGGAAIGAIAGGGVGAAVGAGAGAAAGTVGAAITGKKQVTIPAESVIGFRLGAAVRV